MPSTVTSLHLYPVKGCRGTSPAAALAQARGFAGDRRWMIIDADGHFISQRSRPPLALISPDPRPGCLELAAPGRPSLLVPLNEDGGPRATTIRDVVVWNDTVAAVDAGDEAAEWLRNAVGESARLVFMPADARRAVDERYGAPGDHVSFADAYPYLLVSTASLDDLNARLARPLPMDRFRPNLVVTGCAPYAEDGWRRVRIGPVVFRLVKPCTRCTVTTIDQATGTPDGPEPLRTLAGYRNGEGGVRFGMNLIAEGEGVVRAGYEVQRLD
jgi:uncharacterized protein YcbX